MKIFEYLYIIYEPILPPLRKLIRKDLKNITSNMDGSIKILDVGGRKSPYTVGLNGKITLSELHRETKIQQLLNLGITNKIIEKTLKRRSNIESILYDDMTKTKLEPETYNCVVAVEVLEHVEKDVEFIKNVYKVLKPGGVFYMTTPNGDCIPNENPDHVRHYKKKGLEKNLNMAFEEVDVIYAIKDSISRKNGLKSYSLKRPFALIKGIYGNIINYFESIDPKIKDMAIGTHHLIASCVKLSGDKPKSIT